MPLKRPLTCNLPATLLPWYLADGTPAGFALYGVMLLEGMQGSLADLMQQFPHGLGYVQAMAYAREMLLAVQQLHQRAMYHG